MSEVLVLSPISRIHPSLNLSISRVSILQLLSPLSDFTTMVGVLEGGVVMTGIFSILCKPIKYYLIMVLPTTLLMGKHKAS
jgi:hypothetical protein